MFTTAAEAKAYIRTVIVDGANNGPECFDIDTIFDRTFEYDVSLQAFVQAADVDDFWAAIEEAER